MSLRLRFLSSLLLVISFACFASFSAHAQSIFGTITGTVSDPTGAVIANAVITLTNKTSGDVRRSTSNSDGYFSYSSVPAGQYDMLVAVAGFRQYELAGIDLLGAESLNFPIKVEVGTTKTEVEVVSEADQIIPVDSGEKSVVLGEKQLQDFSVVGRNAAEFIKILPGFAMLNSADGLKSGTNFTGEVIGINGNGDGGSQSPLNGAFSANGTAAGSIDITADGAHVSDPGCNCATPVNPNTDMIQEFKVLTSNYTAENSKGPIVINSIAKAGGKDFHGEGYFYARDYVMNSNTWVNNDVGVARPESKYFFPGFNIGGPVLIPGTNFNKNRDKLFFFSGFEAYVQTLDTGLLGATVANSGMLQGNFSPANLATLGAVTASGGPPSQVNSALYPGGIIPTTSINASGLALMKEYPAPNANPATTFGDNYAEDAIFQQNSYQWLSRVDYNISDNTKLFVRYNLQFETQQFPVTLWWRNATSVPYPTPILGKNQSQSVSTSLTHVFNPTMSNEFVFAYTYIDFPNVFQNPAKVSDKAIGNTFTGLYNNGVDQIPSMTSWGGELATILNPSGFQVGGPSAGLFARKNLPSVSDSLSKVWGTHTAKFGVYYEFIINDQPSSNYANGLLQQANWSGQTGNPWADLLIGYTTEYEQTNYDRLNNEGYNDIEFFAQDSWKVSKRLTLDYGLRVSHLQPWYDRQGLGFAIFNPSQYSASAANGTQPGFEWHANTASVPLSGFPSRPLFYAPRFGLAYDIFGTGKTVIRGGWGQYRYHNAQFTQGLQPGQGIQTATVCCDLSFAGIEATNPGTQPFATAGVSSADSESPLTTSYSFTISQRLPFSSMLEASYVGNQSKYLLNTTGVGTNINVIPYGTLFNVGKDPSVIATGEYDYGPYPTYQAVNIANHNLYSNYNALQVSWVRRKGRYDITMNYTFGKSMGIVGADQLDLSQDYGPTPYDRRQIINAAYSIELPNPVQGNKLAGGFVNGWQLSGITQLQSGVNLTGNSTGADLNATGNISSSLTVDNAYHSTVTPYSINGTDQIPLTPIITCNPTANLAPHQYLNGNCFTISTTPGVNGPIVLPEYFGPWFFNSDLSMFKNFQISESKKLQFRFSAYNFMNHPVWSFAGVGPGSNSTYLDFGPNPNGGSPINTNSAFGYTPIKLGNRIVQLALKFYF
jgi:hypothetical protein